MAAFEVPNEPITYEQKLTNFQVPLKKLERDAGFRFFHETRDFKTRNLCDFAGCKLISKETMENILLQRETRNAQNTKP